MTMWGPLCLWLVRQSYVEDHQSRRGQVLKMTEEEARTGSDSEGRPRRVVTARVLFDGTHGPAVNTRTRIRDQDRSPISSDLRRALSEKQHSFSQLTSVRPAGLCPFTHVTGTCWRSQVEPGGHFFVTTVGTLGVASASHFWSRVAAAIGRLTQYLVAEEAATWHVLVADDYHLESDGPHSKCGAQRPDFHSSGVMRLEETRC